MYVPPASGAGAHIETQAPWVELWPPSVLMAHDLRSNQGRHMSLLVPFFGQRVLVMCVSQT
jgi:hypothetical protein